jgi:hypothetical protein
MCRASGGAAASGVKPQLGGTAPAVGASRGDVLFLTTQTVEMEDRLEEALCDRRQLEEALKAS